ncbi:MAG: alpha/beta hydrolase-fold protein [Bacteroidota bacterium]
MNDQALRQHIDAYCSPRQSDIPNALSKLCRTLYQEGLTCKDVEQFLAKGPLLSPPANLQEGKLLGRIPLQCLHLNYQTTFFLYIPRNYEASKPSSLLIIGHGGNGSMSKSYAESTAQYAIQDWISIADQYGFILAAPATSRGWGNIGYSIVSSLRSLLQRWFRLNPHRMYLTGHSMGGHLSWRSALYIGDWWGAVAPMSGGYDYVQKGLMAMLSNVPGYVTFGSQEPYGIAESNRNMRSWLQAHGFEWIVQEKSGGHEIFHDELPKVAEFFQRHPRNPYRSQVWGEAWHAEAWTEPDKQWARYHQWHPHRPIPNGMFHWLRLYADTNLAPGKRQKVLAKLDKLANHIILKAENTHKLSLYLHPELVDFDQELSIYANGQLIFQELLQPDIATLLSTVKEFDDWGRIFWTRLDLRIPGNGSPRISQIVA